MKLLKCLPCFLLIFMFLVSCNNTYEVSFIDFNGDIISIQEVTSDDKLVFPDAPIREGYLFLSWKKIDSGNIYIATYEQTNELYTITFSGEGGELVFGSEVQYLKKGEKPVCPVYEKHMYEFIGFDKEVDIVTKNETYKAIYNPLTIRDIKSKELIKEFSLGWNYVACMDESNDDEKIIDLLLEKGINVLTIPTIWMKYANDDYTIKNEYLEKLKRIVDLAVSKNMFVVICSYDAYNIEWSSLTYKNYDRILDIVNVQWGQLGNLFKNYDEKVIFSFLNEPRNYDTNEVDGEAFHILNELNEYFVNLIRAQGGNNKYRHLFITTGWTRTDTDSYVYFKMPKDDYVMVSLHAYNPFGLVHEPSMDESSFTEKEEEYKSEILKVMHTIDKNYTQKGIPAVITEFAFRDKQNDTERAKWLEYYLSVANSVNLKCFLWDCAKAHLDKDYSFGLIDRVNNQWVYKEYTDKIGEIINGNKYLDFYKEIKNVKMSINSKIILPNKLTNIKTNEIITDFELFYDKSLVTQKEDGLYANKPGVIYIGIKLNDYIYYYKIEVFPDYLTYKTDFELSVKENDAKVLQCYIETKFFSQMRVDYDWYSFDENICSVSKYSTLTLKNDGTVAIMAVHKETKKIGIVVLEIKDKKLISYSSTFQEGIE